METSDNKKANEEEIVSIISQLSKANETAEKARRRAARARVKAEDAAALLQEMTGEVIDNGSDKVAS